jgi:hypothetical protein
MCAESEDNRRTTPNSLHKPQYARAGSAEARCTCPPGLIQSELVALQSALRASDRGTVTVIGASGIETLCPTMDFLRRSVDVQAAIGRHWNNVQYTHTDTR